MSDDETARDIAYRTIWCSDRSIDFDRLRSEIAAALAAVRAEQAEKDAADCDKHAAYYRIQSRNMEFDRDTREICDLLAARMEGQAAAIRLSVAPAAANTPTGTTATP
jgi:hypothetical protein